MHVADFTYVPLAAGGFVYTAFVIDAYAGLIVGWECSASKETIFVESAETTIGLYKTECIRSDSPFRTGPLRTLADVETITAAWVHWYNTSRIMHRLGRRSPAAAEADSMHTTPLQP